MTLENGLGDSVVVKRWTINPEVRGSIYGLTRTFLRHPNRGELV